MFYVNLDSCYIIKLGFVIVKQNWLSPTFASVVVIRYPHSRPPVPSVLFWLPSDIYTQDPQPHLHYSGCHQISTLKTLSPIHTILAAIRYLHSRLSVPSVLFRLPSDIYTQDSQSHLYYSGCHQISTLKTLSTICTILAVIRYLHSRPQSHLYYSGCHKISTLKTLSTICTILAVIRYLHSRPSVPSLQPRLTSNVFRPVYNILYKIICWISMCVSSLLS